MTPCALGAGYSRITLLSDFRIVMKSGGMQKVVVTDEEEKRVAREIIKLDDLVLDLRNRIRQGESLTEEGLRGRLSSRFEEDL